MRFFILNIFIIIYVQQFTLATRLDKLCEVLNCSDNCNEVDRNILEPARLIIIRLTESFHDLTVIVNSLTTHMKQVLQDVSGLNTIVHENHECYYALNRTTTRISETVLSSTSFSTLSINSAAPAMQKISKNLINGILKLPKSFSTKLEGQLAEGNQQLKDTNVEITVIMETLLIRTKELFIISHFDVPKELDESIESVTKMKASMINAKNDFSKLQSYSSDLKAFKKLCLKYMILTISQIGESAINHIKLIMFAHDNTITGNDLIKYNDSIVNRELFFINQYEQICQAATNGTVALKNILDDLSCPAWKKE